MLENSCTQRWIRKCTGSSPPRSAGGVFGWFLLLLVLLAGGIAALAWWAPDRLPEPLRQQLPIPPLQPKSDPVLYRWTDDQGRLQVTDQPPEGRAYETLRYHPDTNVVPSGGPDGTD